MVGPLLHLGVHFQLRFIQYFKISIDLPGGMKICFG
jgi:hypothetical protein